MSDCYFPKDFIQTAEGLVFAVVDQGLEQGKVLCFLRYVRQGSVWKKLNTQEANQLLVEHYPHYLFFSQLKSAALHAVHVQSIVIHHQPRQRLKDLLVKQNPDMIEQDFIALCQVLLVQGIDLHDVGVTGSLLIGAQNLNSDIDLVVYGREQFHQLRMMIKQLIQQGQLQQLAEQDWLASYQRRQCHLSYADYVWHELRKYNKALINQRKFDLNLLALSIEEESNSYQKKGSIVIQAIVLDAQYGFDYPARFLIEHKQASEVVCYTATYTGQAEQGERIEVAGQLEVSNTGLVRILVGSSREAEGEYIKVLEICA
ncbi:MAG: nucleotidyltransferase domain-containing protein [Methyloprofundus sp.]|nr:nucleotidyltransferase domain-containing protein [Methyloprofundus sp.]MDT8424804.1 nucleotidyltransferase domain-containing protein [Methyloprofundus sp.]